LKINGRGGQDKNDVCMLYILETVRSFLVLTYIMFKLYLVTFEVVLKLSASYELILYLYSDLLLLQVVTKHWLQSDNKDL